MISFAARKQTTDTQAMDAPIGVTLTTVGGAYNSTLIKITMTKTKFFMALTAILLFVSCSPDKNNDLLYSCDQPNRTVNITREISQEEALENIHLFAESIQNPNFNRFYQGTLLNVQGVDGRLVLPFMRDLEMDVDAGELNNTLLYLFNFEGGCVVASADRLLNETVYAFLDGVNLTPSDLQHRDPITVDGFVDGPDGELEPVITSVIPIGEVPYSSVCLIMYSVALTYNLPEPAGFFRGDWIDSTTVSIEGSTPRYHQRYPFNKYYGICTSMPTNCNGHYYAGCGPIAMLITIIYNNYSSQLYGYPINRDSMINYQGSTYYEDILAKMAHKLAQEVRATYSEDGTFTTNTNMQRVMRGIPGYENFRFTNFDSNDIISMISNNKPVIGQGINSEDKGHYYIIEGIQMQYQEQLTIAGNQVVRMGFCASHALLTCNMGGGGSSQCYLLPCYSNDSVDNVDPLEYRYNAHFSHY